MKILVVNKDEKIQLIHLLKQEIRQTFPSLSQAAEFIKGRVSCISKVCKNKVNTYKGFKWRYI